MISTLTDSSTPGAYPSGGPELPSQPDPKPASPPRPPWKLIDRATVRACVESLSETVDGWLLALFVDEELGLLAVEPLARGAVDTVSLEERQSIARARELGAAGFLLVHYHPSGDAQPGDDEARATAQLRALVDDLGIPLLDHLVITRNAVHAIGWGRRQS